jgi:hypothetical protein
MEIELPYGLRDLAARLQPDPRGARELAVEIDELGALSRLGELAWTVSEGHRHRRLCPLAPDLRDALRPCLGTAPRPGDELRAPGEHRHRPEDGPTGAPVPATGKGRPGRVLRGGPRRHRPSPESSPPARATRAADAGLGLPGAAGGHAAPRGPRSPRSGRPGPSRAQAGARLGAAPQSQRAPGAGGRTPRRAPRGERRRSTTRVSTPGRSPAPPGSPHGASSACR